MKITIHTRNYTVSDKLRTVIERKLEKINKYFGDGADCIIVCSSVGKLDKMELTITTQGHAFRAQEESKTMYKNIDVVLQKIERQIVKNKERLRAIIQREAVEEKQLAYKKSKHIPAFEAQVKKNKSFAIKVMSDKDAELDLATLDHNFFVYADETTGGVKVMYRRDDGHVGVIDITNAIVKK